MSEVILQNYASQVQGGPMPAAAVRSRAPLRLGLAGGGTDLSPYCDDFGGAVLNATIDRYAHAFVAPAQAGLHLRAVDLGITESFASLADAAASKLPLHVAVHRRFVEDLGLGEGVALSVTTSVDSPPGSGLGSSSALVVALVEAYRRYFGVPMGPYEIARLAFIIEREDMGLAGGRQDQYAATFGGFNFIEFGADDRVVVNPLRMKRELVNDLESRLLLYFTGRSRESARIIESQIAATQGGAGNDAVEAMYAIARAATMSPDGKRLRGIRVRARSAAAAVRSSSCSVSSERNSALTSSRCLAGNSSPTLCR